MVEKLSDSVLNWRKSILAKFIWASGVPFVGRRSWKLDKASCQACNVILRLMYIWFVVPAFCAILWFVICDSIFNFKAGHCPGLVKSDFELSVQKINLFVKSCISKLLFSSFEKKLLQVHCSRLKITLGRRAQRFRQSPIKIDWKAFVADLWVHCSDKWLSESKAEFVSYFFCLYIEIFT